MTVKSKATEQELSEIHGAMADWCKLVLQGIPLLNDEGKAVHRDVPARTRPRRVLLRRTHGSGVVDQAVQESVPEGVCESQGGGRVRPCASR